MYFFPDAELEAILSEDVPYGDLTSRLLGLEKAEGAVECFFREETECAGREFQGDMTPRMLFKDLPYHGSIILHGRISIDFHHMLAPA